MSCGKRKFKGAVAQISPNIILGKNIIFVEVNGNKFILCGIESVNRRIYRCLLIRGEIFGKISIDFINLINKGIVTFLCIIGFFECGHFLENFDKFRIVRNFLGDCCKIADELIHGFLGIVFCAVEQILGN